MGGTRYTEARYGQKEDNPYSIITCVKNKVSFLFRFGSGGDEKLLVNDCKIVINLDQVLRPYGSMDPPDTTYTGNYHVRCPPTDIKTNVMYEMKEYNAIKLTFSCNPFGLNIDDNPPESLPTFIRQRLVPNVPPLCICIPANQLRIPVRIRRILRRITQLSGL